MAGIVMVFDVLEIDSLGNSRHLIQVSHIGPQIGIIHDADFVGSRSSEQLFIEGIEHMEREIDE